VLWWGNLRANVSLGENSAGGRKLSPRWEKGGKGEDED